MVRPFLLISLLFYHSFSNTLPSQQDQTKCLSSAQPGDLVFFAEQSAEGFENAITASYISEDKFVHVGILSSNEYPYMLVHSTTKGTFESTLGSALPYGHGKKGKIVIKKPNINIIEKEQAIYKSKQYIGLPYNDIFSDDNINSKGEFSFYCSQLVEQVYNNVSSKQIFYKHPMAFGNDDKSAVSFWESYFKERNREIPEGELGTHPTSISQSPFLTERCSFIVGDIKILPDTES